MPFACAARPPLLAISRWRFASIDANPRLLFPVPDIAPPSQVGVTNSSRLADPPTAPIREQLTLPRSTGPTLQFGASRGPRRNTPEGTFVALLNPWPISATQDCPHYYHDHLPPNRPSCSECRLRQTWSSSKTDVAQASSPRLDVRLRPAITTCDCLESQCSHAKTHSARKPRAAFR